MKKSLALLVALGCVFAGPHFSEAYNVILNDFEGRSAQVEAEILGDGTNEITVNLSLIDTIADFQAFFLNLDGDLSGLLIEGADVTGVDASGTATMKGTKQEFSLAINLGSAGIGADDIQTTSFVISSDSVLNVGELFGARLTSVGEDREGSRKMLGTIENGVPAPNAVPEPGTMVLLGAGMLALAGFRKRLTK